MKLIFCMAGLYSRFRNAGYTTPKYLLEWRGGTVLGAIVSELVGSGGFDEVSFLANERDLSWRGAIEEELARLSIPAQRLAFVPDTPGQAATAAIAIDRFVPPHERDEAVVFHNVDTVLLGRDGSGIAESLSRHHGYIDVFRADSPAYSYVELGPDGLVRRIAEKIVISDLATSGLYGFSSARLYREAFDKTRFSGREPYVSDVYATLLAEGARIAVNVPGAPSQTVILGTPDEYENERAKWR